MAKTYKAKQGDSLLKIAQMFQTTPQKLAQLNGVTTVSQGQGIRIPTSGGKPLYSPVANTSVTNPTPVNNFRTGITAGTNVGAGITNVSTPPVNFGNTPVSQFRTGITAGVNTQSSPSGFAMGGTKTGALQNMPTNAFDATRGQYADSSRLLAAAMQAVAQGQPPNYLDPRVLASMKSKGVDLTGLYNANGTLADAQGQVAATAKPSPNDMVDVGGGRTVERKDIGGRGRKSNEYYFNPKTGNWRSNATGHGGKGGQTAAPALTPEQQQLQQNSGTFGLVSWRMGF